jgi:type VI secretion system Hcp family effector
MSNMLPMTLKLDDKVKIKGESIVKDHEKEIDLIGVAHNISMPIGSTSLRTSGKPNHEPFVCTTELNSSYPKLLEACSKGSNLGKVVVTMFRMIADKPTAIATYELTDVFITNVSIAQERNLSQTDHNQPALPLVRFGLNYQSISVECTASKIDGSADGKVACGPLNV